MLPAALMNVRVGMLMVGPFLIFSEFLINSIVDNMKGLCQTQGGLALAGLA